MLDPRPDLNDGYWAGDINPDKVGSLSESMSTSSIETLNQVTDEELQEFVRSNALPEYHPVRCCIMDLVGALLTPLCTQISSARMGMDPATSVVDAELRVHGVQGLRVADASVFPTQVTGHPVTVIVAIAERAAELMTKSYQV